MYVLWRTFPVDDGDGDDDDDDNASGNRLPTLLTVAIVRYASVGNEENEK